MSLTSFSALFCVSLIVPNLQNADTLSEPSRTSLHTATSIRRGASGLQEREKTVEAEKLVINGELTSDWSWSLQRPRMLRKSLEKGPGPRSEEGAPGSSSGNPGDGFRN